MTVTYRFLNEFLEDVEDERERQVDKFGDQSDLLFSHPSSRPEVGAAYWKSENRHRVNDGTVSWDGILLEEVWEALAEEDPEKMEAELVQVAAVACAMYEASRRRREEKPKPRIDWSHLRDGRTPHPKADINDSNPCEEILTTTKWSSFTFDVIGASPEALAVLWGGPVRVTQEGPSLAQKPETRPFGSCCPHSAEDADTLRP